MYKFIAGLSIFYLLGVFVNLVLSLIVIGESKFVGEFSEKNPEIASMLVIKLCLMSWFVYIKEIFIVGIDEDEQTW